MNHSRCGLWFWGLLFVTMTVTHGRCEENRTVIRRYQRFELSPVSFMSNDAIRAGLGGMEKGGLSHPINLPARSRMSRSFRPLRQIMLRGGDRFVGECLEWGEESTTFRLLDQRTIQVPTNSLCLLSNPPGEQELINQSFELDDPTELRVDWEKMVDGTQAADGQYSLRIDSSSTGYRCEFPQRLTAARIEFAFRIDATNRATSSGEWLLESDDDSASEKPLIISIGADRRISVTGVPAGIDTARQSWNLSEGWHSFVAITSAEKTWLVVDETMVASFSGQKSSLRAIHFRPTREQSMNSLWIDAFQVRRRVPLDNENTWKSSSDANDRIRLISGDEVYGQVIGLNQASVAIKPFDEGLSYPWNHILAVVWKQSSRAIKQCCAPVSGIVAIIEMQPFFDRPDCDPERWTATVVRVDAEYLYAWHSVVGELAIRWSEVRRIIPQYFGKSLLIDSRRFHLGNSIHSEFERQLPDGTELNFAFALPTIPQGRTYLSVEVADIEAAAMNAPPGSPFLRELRAGKLVTELLINEKAIGNLNSQLRFKTSSQNPERVRLEIPPNLLKIGNNSIRFIQQPLNEHGNEYDDGEIRNVRLEFEGG